MADDPVRLRVVILAPMPLEMKAIVTAFGLRPTSKPESNPGRARSEMPM